MNAASLTALLKKHPIGVVCGLLSLICVVLLYFRSDLIAENQATLDAKSAEAAKILANVRYSEKLPEQTAEIQALTKDLETRLVRAGQLAVNLQYFYKLEAENEVKLVDVRQNNVPVNKAAKTLYTGIPYNISVQGGFTQVLAFLQKLEAGRHFCRFNSVALSKTGASNVVMNINLELLGTP